MIASKQGLGKRMGVIGNTVRVHKTKGSYFVVWPKVADGAPGKRRRFPGTPEGRADARALAAEATEQLTVYSEFMASRFKVYRATPGRRRLIQRICSMKRWLTGRVRCYRMDESMDWSSVSTKLLKSLHRFHLADCRAVHAGDSTLCRGRWSKVS